MTDQTLGKRIAELRHAKGYSQEYVAEEVGVSRQAVSKWEQDLSAPDTYNLIVLSRLFGVSVDYLATGTLPPPPVLPAPPAPSQTPAQPARTVQDGSTQRTVGFILLGSGIGGVLIGWFLSYMLAMVGGLLILGGVLCLTVRRFIGLVLLWTYWIIGFLLISILTAINLFSVFHPGAYQDGITLRVLIVWGFWLTLLVAVAVTVWWVRRQKKPSQQEESSHT